MNTDLLMAASERGIHLLFETETIAEDMGRLTAAELYRKGVGTDTGIVCFYDPADPGAAKAFTKHLETEDRNGNAIRYHATLRRPRGKQDLQEYLQDVRIALKVRQGGVPRTVVGGDIPKLPWEMSQYRYAEPKRDGRPTSEKPISQAVFLMRSSGE